MCPSPPAVPRPPPQPNPRKTGAKHKATDGTLSQLFVSILPGRPGHSSHWSTGARRVRLCRWAERNEGSAGGITNVKASAGSFVLCSVLAAFRSGQRRPGTGGSGAAQTRWMVGLARGRDGRFLPCSRRLAGRLGLVEVLLGKRDDASGHGLAPDRRRNLRLDGGSPPAGGGIAPAQGIARRSDALD